MFVQSTLLMYMMVKYDYYKIFKNKIDSFGSELESIFINYNLSCFFSLICYNLFEEQKGGKKYGK